MTMNQQAAALRSKKIGVLLRDARTAAGKSVEDCAGAIGIQPDQYEAYEFGDAAISLPELEILAFYLQVPPEHFWGQKMVVETEKSVPKINPGPLLMLRQRMIGVMLKKARQESGLSLPAFSEKTGLAVDDLERYELGEEPVPMPSLEVIAQILNRPIKDFQDRSGPVGVWVMRQAAIKELQAMPPELAAFVCKPINRPYLELAQRLSEMSVERLRAVAEGLLEITL